MQRNAEAILRVYERHPRRRRAESETRSRGERSRLPRDNFGIAKEQVYYMPFVIGVRLMIILDSCVKICYIQFLKGF